jgi:hypothetical protein
MSGTRLGARGWSRVGNMEAMEVAYLHLDSNVTGSWVLQLYQTVLSHHGGAMVLGVLVPANVQVLAGEPRHIKYNIIFGNVTGI